MAHRRSSTGANQPKFLLCISSYKKDSYDHVKSPHQQNSPSKHCHPLEPFVSEFLLCVSEFLLCLGKGPELEVKENDNLRHNIIKWERTTVSWIWQDYHKE